MKFNEEKIMVKAMKIMKHWVFIILILNFRAQLSAYVIYQNYLWNKQGQLNVCFSSVMNKEIRSNLKDEILKIANLWLQETKLFFVLSEQSTCHIHVGLDSDENSSQVGKLSLKYVSQGPTLLLEISSVKILLNKEDQHTILHEFGHALGLEHEHSLAP